MSQADAWVPPEGSLLAEYGAAVAWPRQFYDRWMELMEGGDDHDLAADMAQEMYRAHWDRDPATVAEEQFALFQREIAARGE